MKKTSDLFKCIITDTRIRATLIGSIIIGILSQGMGLFNVYSCHDDAITLFSYGETYTLGRWLTHIIERLSVRFGLNGDGVISMTLPNGVFLLACVIISACFVIRALDIADKYLCALIGGLMISVPTITCYMGYRYNAVQFGVALLLSAAGAYLACGSINLRRNLLAIVLLGCSAGAYQGFIPFAICVILFWCIKREITQSSNVLLYASKLAIIVMGTLFYSVANRIYLLANHYEMIPYRGIDTVTKIGAGDYLIRVLIAYKQFIFPKRETLFYIYPSNIRYVYYMMGAIAIVLVLIQLIRIFRNSFVSGILLMLMFAVVPLACNFMIVMAGVDYMYSTMTYAQMMPFILAAMLGDIFIRNNSNEKPIESESEDALNSTHDLSFLRTAFITLLVLLDLMYVRYDNKLYMIAEYTQSECISYFTTLITRIQSLDGYDTSMPVAYINEYDKNTEGIAGFAAVPSYHGVRGRLEDVNVDPYWTADVLISNYAWKSFMNNWCGYSPELVAPTYFSDRPEVLALPHYPDSGSICIIDDTIVVNF